MCINTIAPHVESLAVVVSENLSLVELHYRIRSQIGKWESLKLKNSNLYSA